MYIHTFTYMDNIMEKAYNNWLTKINNEKTKKEERNENFSVPEFAMVR